MKYFLKYRALLGIFSVLSVGMITNISYANDNFDWSDLKITNSYDSSDDELTITFTLEDVDSRPDDDYEIRIYFDGRYYTKDMSYDSSDDELAVRFTFDISKNNISNSYIIRYYAINDDDNTTEYSRMNYKLVVNNDTLNWSNLKVTNVYNKNKEKLTINYILNSIHTRPNDNYKVKMYLDGKYYKENIDYNSKYDKLTATFIVPINKNEIKKYHTVRYYIVDKNDNVIYSTTNHKMYVDGYELDWSDLDIDNSYDDDDEELTITFTLEDVDSRPDDDYEIRIYFDGRYYTKDMSYDSSDDELTAEFTFDIDEDDIEDYYTIRYYAINDDDNTTEYSKTNYKMYVDENSSSSSSTSERAEIITKILLQRIDDLGYSSYEKIGFLRKIIERLEDYADSKSSIRSLVNEVIDLLEDEIDDLGGNSYYNRYY